MRRRISTETVAILSAQRSLLSRERPSCADQTDTRTYEARGAEAPGHRTAASRLLRRVRRRAIDDPRRDHRLAAGTAASTVIW